MGFWDKLLKSSIYDYNDGNYVSFRNAEGPNENLSDYDFGTEFADELYADAGGSVDDSYTENGIFLKGAQDVFRLTYSGILAKDGAKDIYAVVGQEENGKWKDVKYYPMHKADEQTYEVLFPVRSLQNINLAFKDGADHWDNNSGRNYTYK